MKKNEDSKFLKNVDFNNETITICFKMWEVCVCLLFDCLGVVTVYFVLASNSNAF